MSRTLVTCFALILGLVGFGNYPAVLPSILSETTISESRAGFAGSAFFLAYAAALPVFAALTDKIRAKQLYLIGCSLAISGGLIFPWLGDLPKALSVS